MSVDTIEVENLSDRSVRALTEIMTVLPDVDVAKGADGMYAVVSQSGSQYIVDAIDGSCTCPDATKRDVVCKHVHRTRFATGQQSIPEYVETDALDSQMGQHVAGEPVFAALDGGVRADETTEDGYESDDECDCEGLGKLPCWPCVREGRKELTTD